jgi:hypothetical protein
MGTPLKVSDELFRVAREEATAENRSITAQVEHWARIGRAVEAVLAHDELLGLKKAGPALTPVYPTAKRRREVHDMLAMIAATTDRSKAKRSIGTGAPLYGTDPKFPGLIVQLLPDGTRTPGRMVGRAFVPSADVSGADRTIAKQKR